MPHRYASSYNDHDSYEIDNRYQLGYGRERRNSFGQSFPFTSCNTGASKNDIGGLRNAMTVCFLVSDAMKLSLDHDWHESLPDSCEKVSQLCKWWCNCLGDTRYECTCCTGLVSLTMHRQMLPCLRRQCQLMLLIHNRFACSPMDRLFLWWSEVYWHMYTNWSMGNMSSMHHGFLEHGVFGPFGSLQRDFGHINLRFWVLHMSMYSWRYERLAFSPLFYYRRHKQ